MKKIKRFLKKYQNNSNKLDNFQVTSQKVILIILLRKQIKNDSKIYNNYLN